MPRLGPCQTIGDRQPAARRGVVGERAGLAYGVSLPNVSEHLAILRDEEVVTNRRQRVNVYHRVADSKIIRVATNAPSVPCAWRWRSGQE